MKFTRLSGPTNAPTIYIVPGGPGLSSLTLRSLDLLSRSFHLAYFDCQGTNGTEYDPNLSLTDVAHRLADLINRDESSAAILLGHSAGGIIAGIAADRVNKLSGVVLLSVPLSRASFDAILNSYKSSPVAGSEVEVSYTKDPTELTMRNWVAAYGEMYFSAPNMLRGQALINSDPMSFKYARNHRAELSNLAETSADSILRLRGDVTRLWIADDQGFLPVSEQRRDADSIKAIFEVVSESSHFLSFDQPERVARLVEKYFATQTLGVPK